MSALYEQARAKAREDMCGEKVATEAINAAVSFTLEFIEQEARRRAEELYALGDACRTQEDRDSQLTVLACTAKGNELRLLADFCRSHRGTP